MRTGFYLIPVLREAVGAIGPDTAVAICEFRNEDNGQVLARDSFRLRDVYEWKRDIDSLWNEARGRGVLLSPELQMWLDGLGESLR